MVEYKVYGKAHSRVIVLIHGALVTQSMWKYQVEFLEVKHLILAETAFGTKNSLYERLMTSFSQLLLRFVSKQQIIALSAKSYGSVKEETRAYLADEMSQYAKEQILRVMSAAINYRGKAYLRQIEAPTLIMVGEDNKTTHRQAQQMKNMITNAELIIIPQANHLLNIDNPDDFNRFLKAFISDHK